MATDFLVIEESLKKNERPLYDPRNIIGLHRLTDVKYTVSRHSVSVLIQLCKHKHLFLIVCIKLDSNKILIYVYLNMKQFMDKKSVFYVGLKLCITFNINKSNFNNLFTSTKHNIRLLD